MTKKKKETKKYLYIGTAIGLGLIIIGLLFAVFTSRQEIEPIELTKFEDFSGAIEEFFIDYDKLNQNIVNHPKFEELIARIRDNEQLLNDDDLENDTNAYMGVGFDSNSLDGKETAIRAYRAVLDTNVRNFIALNNLAILYKNMKQFEKAEIVYLQLIDFNPGDPPNYRSLADLYRYQLPEKEELIPALMEKVLERRPEHPDILSWLATYWQDKENTQKAIEYFERLLEVTPENIAAQNELNKLKNR